MNKSIHRCPYDDSREPSLIINWPEKTFQCMNCGVRGDVGEIEQLLIPKKEEAIKLPEPTKSMIFNRMIFNRKFKKVPAISTSNPCIDCIALLVGGPPCGLLPACYVDREGKEREQFIFQWVED